MMHINIGLKHLNLSGSSQTYLCYLNGTITSGLHLPAPQGQPLSIHAYFDANWASDPDDHCSTFGTCIFLGPNLIFWWSKK